MGAMYLSVYTWPCVYIYIWVYLYVYVCFPGNAAKPACRRQKLLRSTRDPPSPPPPLPPPAGSGSRTHVPRIRRSPLAALLSRPPEGASEAAAPPGAGRPVRSSSLLYGRRSGRSLCGWPPPRWAVAIAPPPPRPAEGSGLTRRPARPGPAALSGSGLPKEAGEGVGVLLVFGGGGLPGLGGVRRGLPGLGGREGGRVRPSWGGGVRPSEGG